MGNTKDKHIFSYSNKLCLNGRRGQTVGYLF